MTTDQNEQTENPSIEQTLEDIASENTLPGNGSSSGSSESTDAEKIIALQ